jgi:osmotically-inducible protein OsmY
MDESDAHDHSDQEHIVPEEFMKLDTDIRRDVEAELDWDPRFDSREIGVAVKDGIVTLSGHVNSYPESWAAQQAALKGVGVKAVANEMEVKLPGDSRRSDTDIAQAAVTALDASALVTAADIQVSVNNGWITLKGSVGFWHLKDAAERIVSHLRGITGISNEIVMKPAPAYADVKEVKRKIEAAFHRHAHIDAQNVQVNVGDGTVTLAGEVHSWLEREQAEAAVWASPGVSRVDNRIAIHP